MSLHVLFQSLPDVEIVGEAAEADEALEVLARVRNKTGIVILVGVELGGEHDSFWLIRAIRDRFPQLTILATGTDLQPGAISRALFMGADGFIHKNSSPERFVEATRRAWAGELVLEGLPRGALGGILDGISARAAPPAILTAREFSVLEAAAEGLTAREIGRRLDMRERTVTTHLNHIYRKLGASGRVAALAAASRLGLFDTNGGMPAVASEVELERASIAT
jgi:DNA-binding NarL/FixJ family response regulator